MSQKRRPERLPKKDHVTTNEDDIIVSETESVNDSTNKDIKKNKLDTKTTKKRSVRAENESSTTVKPDKIKKEPSATLKSAKMKKEASTTSKPVQIKKEASTTSKSVEITKETSATLKSAKIKKEASTTSNPVQIKKEATTTSKPVKIKKEPSSILKSAKIKKEASTTSNLVEIKKQASTTSKPVKIKNETKSECTENVFNWSDHNLLAEKENINTNVAYSIIELFESGNTIPFIARYCRDLTDNLPPEKLREIKDSYEDICSFKLKAENVLKTIDTSGNLTTDLKNAIGNCKNLDELVQIYAPFKSSKGKKTLAERAKNLGLDKPAQNILNGDCNVDVDLYEFVNQKGEKGVKDVKEVENSIVNLVAHYIATNNEVLEFLRENKPTLNIQLETKQTAAAKKRDNNDNHKFEQYFSFSILIKNIKAHQTLAIKRGETLEILSVKLVIPDLFNKLKTFCEHKWLDNTIKLSTRVLIFQKACDDAYKRIIEPLIRRQTMKDLTTVAKKASAQVFAENLKNLLLEPPIKGKVIMGIDPGFELGCKIAVISPCGEFIDHAVIYPHTRKSKNDRVIVGNLLLKYKCSIIALGDGTACRETAAWLTNLLKLSSLNVVYTIVNERGASVYSCSDEAKKEFPEVDPLVISAISLARRIQDPLAELVKVNPKSLGVGMYQHDLHRKDIESIVREVVSECVSFVGVDLNTASESLLKRVTGLSTKRANNILKFRTTNGPFTNRYQLKHVEGIGDKVFKQCAGFLRVGPPNTLQSKEFYKKPDTMPLDCTWVHPESYGIVKKLIGKLGLDYKKIGKPHFINTFRNRLRIHKQSIHDLANELETTEATMKLICEVLSRPLDHDLRNDNPPRPLYKREITSMDDIRIGTILMGRITNVTSFGAFTDIGVGTTGLIHNSAMLGNQLQLGNKVEVKVIKLEKVKSQIRLQLLKVFE